MQFIAGRASKLFDRTNAVNLIEFAPCRSTDTGLQTFNRIAIKDGLGLCIGK
jgi:hypothetical protein